MSFLNRWHDLDIQKVPGWVKRAAYKDKEDNIYLGKTFEYRVKWRTVYYNRHTEYHGNEEFRNMYNYKEIPSFESRFR